MLSVCSHAEVGDYTPTSHTIATRLRDDLSFWIGEAKAAALIEKIVDSQASFVPGNDLAFCTYSLLIDASYFVEHQDPDGLEMRLAEVEQLEASVRGALEPLLDALDDVRIDLLAEKLGKAFVDDMWSRYETRMAEPDPVERSRRLMQLKSFILHVMPACCYQRYKSGGDGAIPYQWFVDIQALLLDIDTSM